MSRFLLVPENFNLKKIKEIELPKNIYITSEEQPNQPKKKQIEPHSDSVSKSKQTITENGKYLSPTVVKYTCNPTLARKVLKFLKDNDFKQNKDGAMIFQNKVYPISLQDSFLNLVNNTRKTQESEVFYDILRKSGIHQDLVPKTKQKYFK